MEGVVRGWTVSTIPLYMGADKYFIGRCFMASIGASCVKAKNCPQATEMKISQANAPLGNELVSLKPEIEQLPMQEKRRQDARNSEA